VELIDHLETFLGQISGGTVGDETTPDGVQVGWFAPDVPFTGVSTMATVGLSRHHLTMSGDRSLHQELLMHLPVDDQPRNAAGLLFQVAAMLIDRGHGLLRGEIVGPYGRLFDRGEMTALYATIPVYLADAFSVCETATGAVVLTWLVPITDDEANYIHTHGWSQFEDALVAEDPDLTDLLRPSLAVVRAHGL
jgi:hypothetical protein